MYRFSLLASILTFSLICNILSFVFIQWKRGDHLLKNQAQSKLETKLLDYKEKEQKLLEKVDLLNKQIEHHQDQENALQKLNESLKKAVKQQQKLTDDMRTEKQEQNVALQKVIDTQKKPNHNTSR